MELETIRCVRDWLDGTTSGANAVNTLIPTTPLDAGDPVPALFATFADATREPWVVRRRWPRDTGVTLPVCVVLLDPPFTMPGEVETIVRDAHPTVVVLQLAESPLSADLQRDCYYRRRAILRSLAVFNQNANVAARQRNSVTLLVCESIDAGVTTEDWGDVFALDALRLTYLVRDHAP
jgi:hypothetical protein